MAEYEEKFIVINKKRFDELDETMLFCKSHPAVIKLQKALKEFEEAYESYTGGCLNQK